MNIAPVKLKAIHVCQSLVCVIWVREGYEAKSPRAACLAIIHNAGLDNIPKSLKRVLKRSISGVPGESPHEHLCSVTISHGVEEEKAA